MKAPDSSDSAASNPPRDLGTRTRAYAVRIVHVCEALPKRGAAATFGNQLLRSGTSVGAHVAEASRAKSRADFTCKINGAKQELAESLYWMDLLTDIGAVKASRLQALKDESSELMAIFVSMTKKTSQR